jgi:hypothetical protein
MGRWCYFSNEFQYKFLFGIQDSGFKFLDCPAVDVNEECEYMLEDYNVLEEHPFCDTNCDKDMKCPTEMLVVGNNLFCDEDCKANFTGDEPDNLLDINYLTKKYKFLNWAKQRCDEYDNCFTLSDLLDTEREIVEPCIQECRDNGINFTISVTDSDTFLDYIKESWPNYNIPKFSDFGEDNTEELYDNLLTQFQDSDNDVASIQLENANFCLACLLYHMTLHNDGEIAGNYEVN